MNIVYLVFLFLFALIVAILLLSLLIFLFRERISIRMKDYANKLTSHFKSKLYEDIANYDIDPGLVDNNVFMSRDNSYQHISFNEGTKFHSYHHNKFAYSALNIPTSEWEKIPIEKLKKRAGKVGSYTNELSMIDSVIDFCSKDACIFLMALFMTFSNIVMCI